MNRWRKTHSEYLLQAPWLTIERNAYEMPGKEISDYYVIRRKPFVLIVAETSEGILLVRQYRPATDKYYLCLPAGYVEAGEPVLAAAARELREETGAEARDCSILGTLDPLPGFLESQ